MIKAISFHDLRRLPALQALNAFDMLKPEVDEIVFPHLHFNGMDTQREVFVQACQHRTLDNKVQMGFRYVGYERIDSEWKDSGRQSLEARIEANRDATLKTELYILSREGIGEKGFVDMAVGAIGREGMTSTPLQKNEVDENYEMNRMTLQALNQMLHQHRGYSETV